MLDFINSLKYKSFNSSFEYKKIEVSPKKCLYQPYLDLSSPFKPLSIKKSSIIKVKK